MINQIYIPLFIIGVLAGALIGISCASILAEKDLKKAAIEAAIENECGQFHPKTGKFEWITLTNGEGK